MFGEGREYNVYLVLLDTTNAFDEVYHPALVFKIKKLKIYDNIPDLIESYLTYRKQYVVINGKKCNAIGLETSILQGSNLEFLLFSMYVKNY